MKIKIELELPYDNEIQFYDVCNVTAEKLQEMGKEALDKGHEQFRNTTHDIVNYYDDDNPSIGSIKVSK